MNTIPFDHTPYLPPQLRNLDLRQHPLDGKLLLFERDSGLNLLMEGDEVAHLKRVAPRTLLVAVTNACNLTCSFCYRDQENRSLWRYDSLLHFCQQIDQWGVLEVAFGGGEPMLFPRWVDFINELYETTNLCVNFTTNGLLLDETFLEAIRGKYGQIRVSLYEDNHWVETIALLTRCHARFGVNWLITPAELPYIESKFAQLLALGVRDFLLLGYKGVDKSMHLQGEQLQMFSRFINKIHTQFGSMVMLELDICWGKSLPDVPRLFQTSDCGAGDEFLSITSDRHLKACSFQETPAGIPFETVDDLREIWERQRSIHKPAHVGGCARLPERGLGEGGIQNAVIPLAAIQ